MKDYLGIPGVEVNNLPAEHPLLRLARSSDSQVASSFDSQVANNTEAAARLIATKNPQWLASVKRRLLDITAVANSSSALGEIRAYGSLLETWMIVKPDPSVADSPTSPDFEVDCGDGEVVVEVHSRQLDKNQIQALAEHQEALFAEHELNVRKARTEGRRVNVVTSGATEIFPYGAPEPGKIGDTVVTNAISRIAGVKGTEHQIDESKPFVLWLDLQDQKVWGIPAGDENFSPVYSAMVDGHVDVGVFWFALYGRKGDPLILSKGFDYDSMPLAHEGRFYQTVKGRPSRVSAFVFSLPLATVIMENPHAARPLPPAFRVSMLKAPFFRLDLSLLEWEPGVLSGLIAAQRHALVAAERALKAFDPYLDS